MKKSLLLVGLVVLLSCGRDSTPRETTPADSVTAAPVVDSTATAPGAKESPLADTVMARDTARSM
jgi:hypothetical protein